jgi:hypothetical protein
MNPYAAVSDDAAVTQRTDCPARRVALWACVLLGSACGPAISSAHFVRRAPRPPDHPILIYSSKLPTCPYEEIGIINGKQGDSSLESTLNAVRKRAREMGGDAVVGLSQTQTVSGGTYVSTSEGLAVTVVRFTDEACREPHNSDKP